jgi:hypothetical protein
MKIKDNYILRLIADTHVVIPVAERVIEFKGMMVLNDISADIWEFMKEHRSRDEILEHVLDRYETDRETAEADLTALLSRMETSGVLEI